MTEERARAWGRRAGRLRRKLNFAQWAAHFLPCLLPASVVAAGALLLARRSEVALAPVALGVGLWLLACALGALAYARRSFFTDEQALVRLDLALGLGERLVVASEGVGEWPRVPERAPDGLRWRRPLLVPVIGALAVIAAAAGVPVESRRERIAREVVEPLAWARMEAALLVLEREPVFDEGALGAMRDKLDTLRGSPVETWYEHRSLEAGDSLEDRVMRSLEELGRNVDQVERALAGLEAQASSAEAELARQQALERLGSGDFPLRPELLRQLDTTDPGRLRRVSPEQHAQLRENLERAGRASALARGVDGESWRRAEPGGVGQAGIDRGRADAPLSLYDDPTTADVARVENVSGQSLERAVPGDLLEVRAGEHTVDPTAGSGWREGGAVDATGRGGDAAWRNPLPPHERELLRRYFR